MKSHLPASIVVLLFIMTTSKLVNAKLMCFISGPHCSGGHFEFKPLPQPAAAIRSDAPILTVTTTTPPPTTTTTAEKDPIEVDKEAVMCVEKKCARQLRSLSVNWQNINERTLNDFCVRYGAIKACIATECFITSTVSDFLRMFGTAEFLCSERKALLNHGVCLLAALRSGHMSSSLPEPLLTFFEHLHSEHGGLNNVHSSNNRRLRVNRSLVDEEGGKIATLLAMMKQTASYFPASALTCQNLVSARASFVERASDECDQDDDEDNTKAAAFARRAFGEYAKRLFNVVKSLHPAHNLIDVEACWANEEETESSGFSAA